MFSVFLQGKNQQQTLSKTTKVLSKYQIVGTDFTETIGKGLVQLILHCIIRKKILCMMKLSCASIPLTGYTTVSYIAELMMCLLEVGRRLQ